MSLFQVRSKYLWIVLDLFARSTIYFFLEFGKFASYVSGVTVEHGRVAGCDLSRMVHNDNLKCMVVILANNNLIKLLLEQ